jgi:hypothetical protein
MDTIHAQLKAKRGETIAVEIPTDAEIERIAMGMHAARKPCLETIVGCQVFYRPRQTQSYTTVSVDPFTGKRGEESAPSQLEIPAEFTFGHDGPWKIVLTWKAGDEQPPTWFRYEDRLIRAPKQTTRELL